MEFGEKLQALRKSRGLTQEELAEALYVSRTAVSKWESGRGYPGIDSLKEISRYFAVTIDDLLSAEKAISIAEKENRSNIRKVCDLMSGMADMFAFLLIVLPLYPKTVDGYIYAVNLPACAEKAALNRAAYWIIFLGLVLTGALKMLSVKMESDRYTRMFAGVSMALGIAAVMILALAGETYAAALSFLLLIIKAVLLFRRMKAG